MQHCFQGKLCNNILLLHSIQLFPDRLSEKCARDQRRSVHIRTYAHAYSLDLRKNFFSLNLLANNFIFSHYTGFFIRIPINQASIIQCWPLIMAKCIWVVSKNASCTPPSRSASLTSFPSPAGILEGEVTMPWRVASEQNVFAVNGDEEYTCEVNQWSPSDCFYEETVRESYEYFCDLRSVITGFCSVCFVRQSTHTWLENRYMITST